MIHFWCPLPVQVRTNEQTCRETYRKQSHRETYIPYRETCRSPPQLARLRATSKLNMSNTWPRGGGYWRLPITNQSPITSVRPREEEHTQNGLETRRGQLLCCTSLHVHHVCTIFTCTGNNHCMTELIQFFIITSFSHDGHPIPIGVPISLLCT